MEKITDDHDVGKLINREMRALKIDVGKKAILGGYRERRGHSKRRNNRKEKPRENIITPLGIVKGSKRGHYY